jgi:hypothetical protein
LDARFSSSPAAHGSVAGLAVNARSGPGVVWLVFLFFLLFFSSFFSLASLGRRRRKGVRRKVSQGFKMLQEYSRGVLLNPPPLAWEDQCRWRRRRRFAG